MSLRYCETGRQQYTILGVRFPPLYNSVLQGRRFLRCGCRGHLTKEHLSMIPPTTSGLGYIAWHLGQVANSIKLLLSTPTSLRIVCWEIGIERARVRSDSIDRTVAQTSKNCLRNFISKVVVRSDRLVIACSINTPMRNNFFRAEVLGVQHQQRQLIQAQLV